MGYPEWKNALWTVHSSTSRGHFFVWEKPVAWTGQIINLLLSVIYCNLSLARIQRLFRGEKYLSGLYADDTFREVVVPEQDMRRIIYSLIKFEPGRDAEVVPG
ncbi:hypothetical protein [Allisonella histaminiformans]|uniref:hypothetical protein n=1 Tax=Allisonella histaminiformans TaxID=209880 RepID=UPI003F8C229A